MTVFDAIILGIVQGLSEFLPVSSSGHLTLLQDILGVSEAPLSFDVLLHLGTLVPVLIIYREDVWKLIKNPFQRLTVLLIFGTIPAVIIALLFGDLIDSLFAGGVFLAFSFLITGCLLIFADTQHTGRKSMKSVTPLDALLVGVAQAIALTPGISRSGSTITGALLRGMDRKTAARFSFLLSIPAILGATALEVMKMLKSGSMFGDLAPLPLVFGFVASMLTGYLAITFMLRLIEKAKLKVFSFYLFPLAVFVFIYYQFIV